MPVRQAHAGGGSVDALIIGGGVAGPALALFLDKIGMTSVVYEAHPRADGVGIETAGGVRITGGFQIAPNGMNVLKELGLVEDLRARSAIAAEMCFVRPNGRTLGRFRNGRPERNGVTAITTTRATFIGGLLDAVEKAGIRIEHGKRLREISNDGDGVTAHFEDGTSAHGRFLVGADGIGSRTRSVIMPDVPGAAYLGLLGFGGSVLAADLEAAIGRDTPGLRRLRKGTITFVVAPSGQFGYSRNDNDGLCLWWTHLPRATEPSKAELQAMSRDVATRTRLMERSAGWHEPVPTLIGKTEQLTVTGLYSLPPLRSWHVRNVVLVGDAAHGTSPSSGLGASLALEDAMVLAKLLRGSSRPPEQTFADFHRVRDARTRRCAAMAEERDAREKAQLGTFASWMRDNMLSVVLPLAGERGLRWQYEFKVGWDA